MQREPSIPVLVMIIALASACAERPRPEPIRPPDDEGDRRAPAAPSQPQDGVEGVPSSTLSSAPMAAGKSQRLAVGLGHRNSKRLLPSSSSTAEAESPARADPAPAPGEHHASAASQLSEQPGFLEKPEETLLESLRSATIERVVPSEGGSRPGVFDLVLAGDIQARFEPERTASKGRWSAPIAAYQLDRALGLGRVPPVVGRTVPFSMLERASATEATTAGIVRDSHGNVRGALMQPPKGKLAEVRLPGGWEQWLSVEPLAAPHVSPYQPGAAQPAASKAGRDRSQPAELGSNTTPEPPSPNLPAELSDMILFDYLTLDTERFAEGPASVSALSRRGSLIWLDNGSFSGGPEAREIGARRLAGLSRFRRRTIDALRALDVAALGARMQQATPGPLLDRKALAGLDARKRAALAHVDQKQRRFGDAVYAW